MIVVTGATGTVGRVVARLLARDHPVRLFVRSPDKAGTLDGRVEVVRGQYDDRDALRRALEGARAAFLVTNHPTEPDDARFAEAAAAVGLRHVVKLSGFSVGDPEADDFITRRQQENEEIIRASGLDWTFLRPRAFMSNTLSWAASVRNEGVVRALHGGAGHSVIDPRDVAEAAVRALTEPGHAGRAYALTGPEAITAAEQAEQLGKVLGRPLEFRELTVDQARESLLRRYPPVLAEALLRSAEHLAAGRKAHVTRTFEELVGRRPASFGQWAADHRTAFC
ncbi:NAD(P)H-binding protein [Streptomyces sp. NPDC006235]|uniref:NAD(P)H-binding protein n=1 Tax=Streptomyces sp. NPDC006235 TaxID=3156736 RepID=UPI0033AB4B8E